MRRFLLVATMRNEGPFILEWVAYHRAIGFTDIIVCTNDCLDGSPLLLDRLAALGVLAHHRTVLAPGDKPQLAAYAQVQMLPIVTQADWVMVLDADEFLNVHVGSGTVEDLVAGAPNATAILVNWRVFGSAGHHAASEQRVTQRFTRAATLHHGVNWSFKTLFTQVDAYHCRFMPHQPRYPLPERLAALHYVDGASRTLPRYFVDESRDAFLQSEPGTVSWHLAQVNHYHTRSWEDYLVKHHRGNGLNDVLARDRNWFAFDRNEVSDRTILRHDTAMARGVAKMLADSAIRQAHETCHALYRSHAHHRLTKEAVRP